MLMVASVQRRNFSWPDRWLCLYSLTLQPQPNTFRLTADQTVYGH